MGSQAVRTEWLVTGLGLLAFGGAAFAQRPPPSSLREKTALVHFNHAHERVVRCVSRGKTPACVAKRVKGSAAAEIKLIPLPSTLVSEPTDARAPISLVLPDASGSSSADSRLKFGRWRLSWADQTAELHVGDESTATIRLVTASGRCVQSSSGCERDDSFTQRQIVLPAVLRGGD
jgi:hypothetical protein